MHRQWLEKNGSQITQLTMTNELYRLLIVDDEPIILSGMCQVVNWQDLGFTVAATAKDGQEALEIIEREKIDVVFSDVRMPRMSGLELSEHIMAHHPEIKVVILSGYNEFEYAQKAIRHGVFAYILKPSVNEEISETFTALKQEMDEERSQQAAPVNSVVMTNAGVIDLLFGRRETHAAQFVQSQLSAYADRWPVRLMSIQLDCSPFLGEARYPANTAYRVVQRLMEVFPQSSENNPFLCYAAEVDQSTIGCILMGEMAAYRIQKPRILAHVVEELTKNSPCSEAIFVLGEELSSLQELPSAWQKLSILQANVSWKGRNVIIEPDDDQWHHFPAANVLERIQNEIVEMVLEGNREAVSTLSNLFSALKRDRVVNLARVYEFLEALFSRLNEEMASVAMQDFLPPLEQKDVFERLRALRLFSEMDEYCSQLLSEAIANANQVNDVVMKRLVKEAVEIIEQEYNTPLMLGDLADRLSVSTTYLSRLFSQNLRISFKTFLTSKRIEVAKEMLHKSTMRINEIAAEVGYPDAHYFSDVFKKEVGITPRKFRQRIRMKDNPDA
jgi:two-component system, response regulator YesN